jgi:uncharacterized protein (TIGR00255 family)
VGAAPRGVRLLLRSMTGFGRAVSALHGAPLTAEVRSLNHRHLEIVLRVPPRYGVLEERLRALIRGRVQRGRVELLLVAPPGGPGGRTAYVDTELAAQYHQALRDMAAALQVPGEVDARLLAALPGVCTTLESVQDAEVEAEWPAVERTVGAALDAMVAMREREGRALEAALAADTAELEGLWARVRARLPLAQAAQAERLRARLEAILGAPAGDVFRPEVAALLERADISEELVRVGSHLREVRACLASATPVGRKLDFLAQELQREWTTIAAKAADGEIAELAVAARVAVERMREQVQNVE